jgi:hypothetical protein
MVAAGNHAPGQAAQQASKSPSVTNCCTSRAYVAPSAPRTAISRLRLSERTSTRLATLTHAISNSRAAPPSSVSRMGRTSPTMISEKRNDWRSGRGRARDIAAAGVCDGHHFGLR